jgi:hypothetical protein
MSKIPGKWQRVNKRRPCPICGKADWCMFAGPENSPEAVICARTESPKRCGDAGWLHVLNNNRPTRSSRVRKIELSSARIDTGNIVLDKLAEQYQAAVKPESLNKLAESMGLTTASLHRLGVGWSAKHSAWTFPMHDAQGKTLGIRLRLHSGKKMSVKGGREGLFLPKGIDAHGLLLVCEGPTDTAALLDLGFNAVGRPSCTGGVKLLIELVRKQKPNGVVIVADADVPGQRGAEYLAGVLVAYSKLVHIITPPTGIKDARQWKQCGATAADMQATFDAAPIRRLAIRTELKQKMRKAIKHGS